MPREKGRKLVASNKKARHDYAILETVEAGLVLTGTEVKSLRAGRASLVDGFAGESGGELMLYAGAHPGVHAGHVDQSRTTPHPEVAAQAGRDEQAHRQAATRTG